MNEKESDYCARRAAQEDEAARQASCAVARDRHLEMAQAYRLRCSVLSAGQPGEQGAVRELA